MLRHVNGERDIVKCFKRRPNGDPQRENSSQKCRKPPRWNEVWENKADAKPANRIDQSCETQREVYAERRGPRFENGLGIRCHWYCAKISNLKSQIIASSQACLPPQFRARSRAKRPAPAIVPRDAESRGKQQGPSSLRGSDSCRK